MLVVFQPSHLSKQLCPSHHNISSFLRLKEDRCLCPVETLGERTASFCYNARENWIFRSFIGKHGLVTSCTIGRWINSCLKKHELTLLNLKHILPEQQQPEKQLCLVWWYVDEMMKAADWSNEGVFQKSYYRPQLSTVWFCSKYFKVTCWYGNQAFWSIIFEWFRLCNGCLLFVIIWGR